MTNASTTTQNISSSTISVSVKVGLDSFLPKSATEVNEEQLFIGEVSRELMSRGGDTLVTQFQAKMTLLQNDALKLKRRLQLEDAGTQAMASLVSQKKIPKTIADKIIKTAWTAAQLDSNPALWDSIDGKNDPTRAVATKTKAIASVDKKIEQIGKGALPLIDPATVRNDGLTPTKTSSVKNTHLRTMLKGSDASSGAASTLWKPISNSSGTASVLIPVDIGKRATAVKIISADGAVIDSGTFTSYGDDNSRAKFVFGKAGAQYPVGSSVDVTLDDGNHMTIALKNPSARVEINS